METPDSYLERWSSSAPTLTGVAREDVRALETYIEKGERLLALLPRKRDRSEHEALQANEVHKVSRELRTRFLELHGPWLYSKLSRELSYVFSLQELALQAAKSCPGLVPNADQLAAELTCVQRDKEGREIDQGIFYAGLFRVPAIGMQIAELMLIPSARSRNLLAQFIRDEALDLGTILIRRVGFVAYLTLNNRDCLNAETCSFLDDFETAVDLTLLDDRIRVGVIRGGEMTHPRYAGQKVFSAGINLKDLRAGQIPLVDFLLRRELHLLNKLRLGVRLQASDSATGRQHQLQSLEKPWIAVVDNFAIGGGAQILLALDHVIAVDGSFLSIPAAQEGLVPGFANLRLTRYCGARMARRIILGGQKILASAPEAACLVDEIVKSTEVDRAVKLSIDRLAAPAIVANRRLLHLAEEPLEAFVGYFAEFAILQAERLYSADVLDTIDSFSTAGRTSK